MIKINRPKAKNAICGQLITELNQVLKSFEKDEKIQCIVLSGDENYFVAGADIKEMKELTYSDVLTRSFLNDWNYITTLKY